MRIGACTAACELHGCGYSENTECTVSYIAAQGSILKLNKKTLTMQYGVQLQPESISFALLESLKGSLQSLEDLRLVPHNDPHVLRLKQHLRKKIAEIEQKLQETYGGIAA